MALESDYGPGDEIPDDCTIYHVWHFTVHEAHRTMHGAIRTHKTAFAIYTELEL